MCVICSQWKMGQLTNKEALRNIGEFMLSGKEDASHLYKVVDDIMDKELGTSSADEDMDKAWHEETHGN